MAFYERFRSLKQITEAAPIVVRAKLRPGVRELERSVKGAAAFTFKSFTLLVRGFSGKQLTAETSMILFSKVEEILFQDKTMVSGDSGKTGEDEKCLLGDISLSVGHEFELLEPYLFHKLSIYIQNHVLGAQLRSSLKELVNVAPSRRIYYGFDAQPAYMAYPASSQVRRRASGSARPTDRKTTRGRRTTSHTSSFCSNPPL